MIEMGKRYRCDECGTEALCTNAGDGQPECCEKEMAPIEPKALPSSD